MRSGPGCVLRVLPDPRQCSSSATTRECPEQVTDKESIETLQTLKLRHATSTVWSEIRGAIRAIGRSSRPGEFADTLLLAFCGFSIQKVHSKDQLPQVFIEPSLTVCRIGSIYCTRTAGCLYARRHGAVPG